MQKYTNSATDPNGRAINGATILVTKASDGTLAPIFGDNGVTTKVNPIVTGPDGEYYFYAANGRYNLAVAAAGFATDIVSDVLLYDAADAPAAPGGGLGDVTLEGVQTVKNKTVEDSTLINPVHKKQTLTDGASIAWNADLGQSAAVTVNATGRTIQVPSNLKDGGIYSLKVTLGGAGYTYAFGAGYIFTAAPTISTTNGAVDTYLFFSDGTNLYGQQLTRTASAPAPAPGVAATGVGTNLSGLEWAGSTIRYGSSNRQNLNITPPRTAEIAALAAQGMKVVRLPISWELIQPVLHDSNANSTVRNAYNLSGGSFAAGDLYEPQMVIIEGVLAACAANGIKCLVDLHNYFRYQDFVYNGDGSVTGFTNPSDQLLQPFTTDNTKVQVRLASKAVGAKLTQANFVNVWQKLATRLSGHAGLGGYGLMNEPHDMPGVGGTEPGYPEDGTISSDFEQAAVTAIRAIDATTPIYVSGNNFDFAATIGDTGVNPGLPLATGTNLVYEVHMYLDANNNGAMFDYDIEVAKNQSAGLTPYNQPIGPLTGYNRIKKAVDWAAANGLKLALTEVGMPVDDVRWQTMFDNAVSYAQAAGCEIYTWMGGSHWGARNYAINHVHDWYQDKMVPPLVEAPLRKTLGLVGGPVFDSGEGFSAGGAPVTIHVWGRGYFATDVVLTVASNNGGAFSKTTLTLAAGLNPSDSFTFTPAGNVITTLSYFRADSGQVPPNRLVYSLTDPVAYEATSLTHAAQAIMAKYKASRFLASDAYTDYLGNGVAAVSAGNLTRAIADSGWGTQFENIHSMLNWWNTDSFMQAGDDWVMPKTGISGGKRFIDQDSYNVRGFWCKKISPNANGANTQPNPKNRALFDLNDSYFQLAAVTVNHTAVNGIAVESSRVDDFAHASVRFNNAIPRMEFAQADGTTSSFPSSAGAIAANTPVVVGMTSAPGAQRLYVDNVQRATGALTLPADYFNQHLMGFGWSNYYPGESLWGKHYGCIYGKGAIAAAEYGVLSRYMATLY